MMRHSKVSIVYFDATLYTHPEEVRDGAESNDVMIMNILEV